MRIPPGIKRHGKSWQWNAYDAAGARVYRKVPTLAEAKRQRAAFIVDVSSRRNGIEPAPRELPPVPRLVEEYLAERARAWTPKHAGEVREQIARVLGRTTDLRVITTAWLSRRRTELAEGRANRTANKLIEAVTTWLRWCESTSRIARAPTLRLDSLPEAGEHCRRRRRALTQEATFDLLRATAGTQIELLAAVIVGAGLRLSQALSLRWEDYAAGRLAVRGEAPGSRKSRRGRTIGIPTWLADRLSVARQRAGVLRGRPEDRIILSPRGLPMDKKGGPERCYRWLRKAMAAAGIPHETEAGILDWHSLRHTYATHLADGGASAVQIQRLLGHATVAQAAPYVHAEAVSVDSAVAGLPDYGAMAGPAAEKAAESGAETAG